MRKGARREFRHGRVRVDTRRDSLTRCRRAAQHTWIRRIEFIAADRKGFWEERGYSNTAEPWFNDRYS